MPAPLVDCPEIERWQALFDDAFSADERDGYERHLETCPACQERLDRIEECGDDLRQLARRVGDPTVVPADPVLRHVRERLHETIGPDRPAATETVDLYFLRPSVRPDLLGMLGDYEVLEVIGAGGMGVVLKAFEPGLNRMVAIKVMAAAVAGSATARRRFTRKAQAAAAVCHEHIVAVHGVHETDELPYLVMQYVAGESLQARLDRVGPLKLAEVLRIGSQTASGLAAAHAQGLIHRDIKPANLLLEAWEGEAPAEPGRQGSAGASPSQHGGRVKITDFGLARMVDDVSLTQNGVVAGTPEYMAPEQARGEAVDHRSDLFSLGSVLYAACTGASPFQGATALAVLRQVCEQEPVSPRTLNPEVPAWLEALILRLLAKNPADRFQSASEVAALLEGYLAHLRQPATVPAPPVPPPPAGTRSGRRLSWLLPAVLVLAPLGVGIALWLAGALTETDPTREYAQEYYQSLKGPVSPPGFELFGPDADQLVHYEPEGLRITMPLGYPEMRKAAGVNIPLVARGDFEITVRFEILQEPDPDKAGAQQTRATLDAVLDRAGELPGSNVATLSRRVRTPGGYQFLIWRRLWVPEDGKHDEVGRGFPTGAKSGRLRMARTGSDLVYWASEGSSTEFKRLDTYSFGKEDLKSVRLLGSTGGPTAALDVRFTDLTIRADSLPNRPESGASPPKPEQKGWLALGLILALVIAAVLGLGLWLHARQRRRSSHKP
jgi:serine/threonine protein kinase